MVEHQHARRQRHDGPHHVLDQQDGEAGAVELAQDGDHPVGLGRPQARPSPRRAATAAARSRARARPRAACDRAASTPPPAASACRTDRGGATCRLRAGAPPATAGWRSSAPMMTLSSTLSAGNGRTNWKVRPMPRRQMRSGAKPIDPLARERDRALIGRQLAGDHVEQGGLAGAVGTDDGEQLAGRDAEAHRIDAPARRESACSPLRPPAAQSSRTSWRSAAPSPQARASQGQTPSGRTKTISIRVRP